MSMKIFDTNILIDYLKDKREAADFMNLCVKQGEQLACSVITTAELLAGIRPGEEDAVTQFLMAFVHLDATFEISKAAGEYMRLYRKTHSVTLADALLAATAKVHQAEFCTLNTKHFPMTDFVVERPY